MRFFARLFAKPVFRDQRGFILIEVAIALIIFGLILGPGFVAWRTHNAIRQNQITRQHQDLIFQALAHHLELHGCLPKASDISSPAWGESSLSSGDRPGIVPYRILGLSARVAKDGFGHWMTYAVDPQMTVPGLQYQGDMCVQFLKTPSALDVIESEHSVQKSMAANHQKYTPLRLSRETLGDDGQSLYFKERFNGIAVVLVSHGYSGWGAPKAPGMMRTPFPSHASKATRINGDDTLTFVGVDRDAAQSANQCIVAWKTRSQIMAQAHLFCMDHLFLKKAPELPSTKSTYSGGGGPMGFPKTITNKR